MIRLYLAALLSVLALPCAQAADARHQMGEVDARRISDAEYEALLGIARSNGWIYPDDQIASGQKRHYQEFRLRLMNLGYEIIPAGISI